MKYVKLDRHEDKAMNLPRRFLRTGQSHVTASGVFQEGVIDVVVLKG